MAKKPPQKMVFTGFPAGFLKWLDKPIADEAR